VTGRNLSMKRRRTSRVDSEYFGIEYLVFIARTNPEKKTVSNGRRNMRAVRTYKQSSLG
jgi:hypothetical protein